MAGQSVVKRGLPSTAAISPLFDPIWASPWRTPSALGDPSLPFTPEFLPLFLTLGFIGSVPHLPPKLVPGRYPAHGKLVRATRCTLGFPSLPKPPPCPDAVQSMSQPFLSGAEIPSANEPPEHLGITPSSSPPLLLVSMSKYLPLPLSLSWSSLIAEGPSWARDPLELRTETPMSLRGSAPPFFSFFSFAILPNHVSVSMCS